MIPFSLLSTSGGLAQSAATSSLNVKTAATMGILIEYTVAASTAKTFVDADVNTTTNRITITSHGYYTGRKVAATTDGVLPGGLSATNYFVIKVDANTIQLAASMADAVAGTAVDITSAAGGGTHTLTPAAISTASWKLQGSFDDSTWFDIQAADLQAMSGNITATGNVFTHHDTPAYCYVRLYFTAATAGQFDYIFTALVKES
jgi:hypothetical protein